MNAASSSKTEPREAKSSSTSGEMTRRLNRRSWWVFWGVIVLLGISGGVVAFRYGSAKTAVKGLELPEIPTVNLEGADPAIRKLVREAQESLERSPHSGILWGQYAMVLHAHGFSDAAHIAYSAAASLDPKSAMWPYLTGDLYQTGSGGSEAAIPYFERAAQLSAPDTLAHLRLADSLLEIGCLEESEREYRDVLSVQGEEPQAQLGLGRLAVVRRQYREALQFLEPIVNHPRVQQSACTLLASVYERLGDHSSAARTRLRLAKIPPDERRADDPSKIVNQLEVGIRAELTRASQLIEQGHVKELVTILEDLVHRYPDSFEAWNALCNACGPAGDPSCAERAARRACQLAPQNSAAWLSLGNVLTSQRRYKDALEPVQKSLELDPQNRQAYHSLGKCRQELGMPWAQPRPTVCLEWRKPSRERPLFR